LYDLHAAPQKPKNLCSQISRTNWELGREKLQSCWEKILDMPHGELVYVLRTKKMTLHFSPINAGSLLDLCASCVPLYLDSLPMTMKTIRSLLDKPSW